jgi:hypothetical protein
MAAVCTTFAADHYSIPTLDTPVTWYYYVGFGGVITACLEKETVNDATL